MTIPSDVAAKIADLDTIIARSLDAGWRPPPKLSLSEWADRFYYLSAESSASVGRWSTIPYQRAIMDAVTDPRVWKVTVQKSARVGWTKILNAAIGFSIHQDPCPIFLVQPTLEDAKGYSREELDPMLRDCPELAKIAFVDSTEEDPKKTKGNNLMSKHFPGGVLTLAGANSGGGFRRITRKRVFLDEVDAYPPSAGEDGDPVKLATKRTESFWDRKILLGSTPLIAGASRIEEEFEAGDQRRYFVPCPQCGHMNFLSFQEKGGGHFMVFDKLAPEGAHFVCSLNGCVIEHHHKRSMVERGEWRAAAPFKGHASFHIWTAYSYSPNATWANIAAEFLEANRHGRDQLKTFVNTTLGETWRETGEVPDWEKLYARREPYPMGTVPEGVRFLTCGVDVQKDRWVYEVVGWGANKESWSIDAGVIPGDTSDEAAWLALDQLLDRRYLGATGVEIATRMLAVDSGYNTQMVYNWARRHVGRAIATKGVTSQRTIVGSPTAVDIKVNGQRIARGAKVWPVGVDMAKTELYGWLRLPIPLDGAPAPAGFCHFPEHGSDFFKQITAEQLVSTKTKQGFTKMEWQVIPGRENHWLDCRVYARAAAAVIGLDRMTVRPVAQPAPAPAPARVTVPVPTPAPVAKPQIPKTPSRFLGGRGKGWLKR